MDYLNDLQVVVAGSGVDGKPEFLEVKPPATMVEPGVVESAWVWGTDDTMTLPDIGSVPSSLGFPSATGSRFGVVCFPPESAGKLRVGDGHAGGDPRMHLDDEDDPGMHRTDSIDYEFVLSGKVDIELPGGASRTLTPGSCLVMGGVAHAWRNRYTEPCIYAAIVIGVNGTQA